MSTHRPNERCNMIAHAGLETEAAALRARVEALEEEKERNGKAAQAVLDDTANMPEMCGRVLVNANALAALLLGTLPEPPR